MVDGVFLAEHSLDNISFLVAKVMSLYYTCTWSMHVKYNVINMEHACVHVCKIQCNQAERVIAGHTMSAMEDKDKLVVFLIQSHSTVVHCLFQSW